MSNDVYTLSLYDKNGVFNHIAFDVHVRAYNAKMVITQNARALLDTGATYTGITSRFAKSMSLESLKTKNLNTANGMKDCPIYSLDIIFPKDKIFENLEVVEITDDQQYDIVIGMDIIKMGDIAITHVDGKMMFSLRIPPAGKYINFDNGGKK